MSDKPRDLTLERINRLTVAFADMMDSQNAHNRVINRTLELMDKKLDRIEVEMRALASEQVLLSNRVENAFSMALRTNIRVDEIEEGQGA